MPRAFLVAALCATLLVACQGRSLSQADAPAAAPAGADGPTAACEPAPTDSIDVPANAVDAVVLSATGTRNFTCVDGQVDKSYMVANVTGDSTTGDMVEGTIYYGADGDVVVDLLNIFTGDVGIITLSADPEDVVTEANEVEGELSHARWTAISNSGVLPATIAYMTRTNATGAEPACEAGQTTPEGEYEISDFAAVYTLYSCS